MRQRFAGRLSFAAAVLVAAVAGVSYGQSDNSAGAFNATLPPPTLSDPVTTVPGATGDVSHLTGMWNDPNGLQQAGQQARPGNEFGDMLAESQGATAGQINANDDWLQSSFDILRNPNQHTGDLVTSPTEECTKETVTDTSVEESIYTCETGRPVEETSETCVRTYVPIFDTDFIYECVSGTQWTYTSNVCEPERIVVVDDDYIYQCRTGSDWTQTPATCTRQRTVVVDEDYVYGCVVVQPGSASEQASQGCSANGQAGCYVQAGPTCTATTPGQTYSCQEGYSGSTTNAVCNVTQVPRTVQRLIYKVMISAGGTDIGKSDEYFIARENLTGCSVQWTIPWEYSTSLGTKIGFRRADVSCPFSPAPPPGWTCSGGLCGSPESANGSAMYEENQSTVGEVDAGEERYNSCGPEVTADPACRQVADTCAEGPETRVINGVSYYRACWRWEQTYVCDRRVDAPGCSPPAGTTLTNQQCASSSNGTCTLWDKTYSSPATCASQESQIRCENPVAAAGPPIDTPRDVIQDFWSNNCGSLASNGNCSKVRETVTDNSPRSVNGLTVDGPWSVQEDYTCWTETAVNSCAPFAGCEQTKAICDSFDKNGNCSGYTKTYRCENPQNDGGTPIETVQEVVQEYWTDPCATLRNNTSCKLASNEVIEGAATKIINGLSVTRDPWKRRETYTCSSSATITKTCGGRTRPADCVVINSVCISSDPNGACTGFNETWRCENQHADYTSPQGTVTDLVGGEWRDGACPAKTDASCRFESTACTKGGGGNLRHWNGIVSWGLWFTGTMTDDGAVVAAQLFPGCTVTLSGSWALPPGRTPENSTYDRPMTVSCPGAVPVDGWDCFGGGTCYFDPLMGLFDADYAAAVFMEEVAAPAGVGECVEETDSYVCERAGDETSTCQPAEGCVLREQQCLDDGVALDKCKSIENIYDCKTKTETTHEETVCKTKVCVGQECFEQEQGGTPDKDMPDALAALMVMQQAGEGQQLEPTVFKGEPMRCRKAVFGFRNCCKDSGWGVDLGLAQCDQEEKTLMLRQEAKSTHYVGTWCSTKSFFGTCLEKSMRYCSFEGTLAKIVQVEGRKQLNKPWGEPKSPDCSGFTVEQFQQLDLSDVDFSEFTNDMMNKVMSPDANSTIGRISSSINIMMGSGTASSPGTGN